MIGLTIFNVFFSGRNDILMSELHFGQMDMCKGSDQFFESTACAGDIKNCYCVKNILNLYENMWRSDLFQSKIKASSHSECERAGSGFLFVFIKKY